MVAALRFLEATRRWLAGERSPELLAAAGADLEAARSAEPRADFLFTPETVLWGPRALEPADVAWVEPLRDDGIAVLAPPRDPAGLRAWLDGLAARVDGPRHGEATDADATTETDADAGAPEAGGVAAARSIEAEAERVWRLHEAAGRGPFAPLSEVRSLVRALAELPDVAALEATPRMISPLDETTTVHALNVALLAMCLARHLAYGEEEILAAGMAGLLHDIGKVRLGELPPVSREVLSPDERAVLRSHAEEGARLLLEAGAGFERAAIVAYEHHMTWEGEGGYPARHYPRPVHPTSRIVAVCDAYDVLRTQRSFRPALDREAALSYLHLIGGDPLDPDVVAAFAERAERPLPRVEQPLEEPAARAHEIGWLPETGYDPDCEPRPVRL